MGDQIVANGINPDTGLPVACVALDDLAALLTTQTVDAAQQRALSRHARREATWGLPPTVTATEIGSAGWGVMFSTAEDDGVRQALAPLVEHRKRQVVDGERFHVLDHQPSETYRAWLTRHQAVLGAPEPTRVPYYILIAGSPDLIPFEFQYLLDVDYAVGRIAFDTHDEYRKYAESVVAYETDERVLEVPRAMFFGTDHDGDGATNLSAANLVRPLAGEGDQRVHPGVVQSLGGVATSLIGATATRNGLLGAIAGDGGHLDLLFSATHGLGGVPPDDSRQRDLHGALLCQDWSGGRVDVRTQALTADAVSEPSVHGLVAFLFGCYSAGTPELDDFPKSMGVPRARIAGSPFVAALPRALLAQASGGALAVIGHVERAWSYSISSHGVSQLPTFENTLTSILLGEPVGHAMRYFNDKYAALSTNLASLERDIDDGLRVEPMELAKVWTERNDTQNTVLLGDPATRLRVAS